jgi:hypothetical protein
MTAAATLAVLLVAIGLASWVVVRFLRRRYREAAYLDGIDMEEIMEELEAAASSLDELAERLRLQHTPDEVVSEEAVEAMHRAHCLLDQLVDAVEYAIAEIEIGARRRHPRRVRRRTWCVDFLSEEEFKKFNGMPSISEDEVRRLDWDDFLKRL